MGLAPSLSSLPMKPVTIIRNAADMVVKRRLRALSPASAQTARSSAVSSGTVMVQSV